MMAMREYANDVRQISEYEWMFGPQDGSDPALDLTAVPDPSLSPTPSLAAIPAQNTAGADTSAPVQ
jgi:hypothetical protein